MDSFEGILGNIGCDPVVYWIVDEFLRAHFVPCICEDRPLGPFGTSCHWRCITRSLPWVVELVETTGTGEPVENHEARDTNQVNTCKHWGIQGIKKW